MTTETEAAASELPLSSILSLAGLYSLFVSALYLYGYWGTFRLNVLEYMGLSELVNHAVFPLFAGLLGTFTGMFVSHVQLGRRVRVGRRANTRVRRFITRFRLEILAFSVIPISAVAWWGPEPWKWFLVVLATAPFGIAIADTDYIARWISDLWLRAYLLSTLLAIAALAFALGRTDAYQIRHGRGPILADLAKSGLKPLSDQPVGYMGHLGGFFVFYESTKDQLVIIRDDKIPTLVLVANPAAS